jgi:STE24 endopeptidase
MESKTDHITIDTRRQEKAKEYSRIRRRLMLVDLLGNGLYAVVWIVTGWAFSLKNVLFTFTDNIWLLVPAFVMVYGGISSLLTLPLSYYSGFVLPHRYGMSNQTVKEWGIDRVKGLAIAAPLGLIMLEIVYAVLRAFPITWWLIAAGIMLIFNVVLANLAPVLIAPIFNKYIPLGEEHSTLESRLINLAKRANTRVKGVFKFDMSRRTKAANAGLTGLGNTRRIVLGDTLIEEFTHDEIETVLAHELGHHVNKDIPIGIALGTLITLVGFYFSSLGLNWGVNTFGFEGIADIAALPLFSIVIGLYSLVTMPLTNGFSRWRERRADQYALEATQKPDAFASAFTRLANQNLADVDPEPWVEYLLHSHPALGKRIRMAEEFESDTTSQYLPT